MDTRKIIRTAVLLSILALVVTVAANLPMFDQKLRGEIKSLLTSESVSHNTVSTYQSIAGIATAGGEDPSEAEMQDRALQAQYTACTSRTQAGCLRVLRDDLAREPIKPGGRLAVLLERYRGVTGLPLASLSAGADSGAHPLPWGMMLRLGGINLADASTVGTDQFLATLAVETAFWTDVYNQGEMIFDKVVAIAGLWTAVQFASEYMQFNDLELQESEQLAAILASMRLDASVVGSAFLSEFRNFASAFHPLDRNRLRQEFAVSAWASLLFLQPNATLNTYYLQVIEPLVAIADMPVEASIGIAIQPRLSRWSVYNPVGRSFIVGAGAAVAYVHRVHDFNGVLGLVEYQLAARSNAVLSPEDFVSAALGTERDESGIAFGCLEQHSYCRIVLNGSGSAHEATRIGGTK
jgi:hypothetical protein